MHAKYFRANGTNEKRVYKKTNKKLLEKEKRPTSACPV